MATFRSSPNDAYSLAWAALNPNFTQINQAAVTNVATTQMLGLSNVSSTLILTPTYTGMVLFKIGGELTIAATDSVQLKPSYGTGTAPTNGQATAGTQVGTGVNITLPTGPGTLPFWTECIITSLVLGTPVWFDLEAIFAAGTLVVSNVVAIALEM